MGRLAVTNCRVRRGFVASRQIARHRGSGQTRVKPRFVIDHGIRAACGAATHHGWSGRGMEQSPATTAVENCLVWLAHVVVWLRCNPIGVEQFLQQKLIREIATVGQGDAHGDPLEVFGFEDLTACFQHPLQLVIQFSVPFHVAPHV